MTEAIDRTGWPAGPWDGEPDRVYWTTHARYRALAERKPEGYWSAYIEIRPGSYHYGTTMQDADFLPIDCPVHGGITSAEDASKSFPDYFTPETAWLIGFSCNQDVDALPTMRLAAIEGYKPLKFVTDQCEALAHALRKSDPVVAS